MILFIYTNDIYMGNMQQQRLQHQEAVNKRSLGTCCTHSHTTHKRLKILIPMEKRSTTVQYLT